MQTWGDFDGIINVNELSEFVRHAAQDLQGFAQLCNPPTGKALGLGKGDTVQYIYYADIGIAGGELDENEEVPQSTLTPISATYQIKEFGNSLRWTKKLEDLSRLSVEDDFTVALVNDMKKLENSQAYTQFKATDWIASFNSSADAFVTNGTTITACNEGLTFANLRYLVRNAEKRLIPYFDGESYVVVTGVDSLDALVYEQPGAGATGANVASVFEALKRDSGMAALNGECGRVARCRLVKDTHKVAKMGGSSSGEGANLDETFLIGADAVQKDVAEPWYLSIEDRDHKRNISVAYLGLMIWNKILDQTTHSKEHIIRVASA